MSDRRSVHFLPRARPVAGAPLDALQARAEDLAKRWAIALIIARPLERIAEISLQELAGEAPSLCAGAVRALGSDEELEQLTGIDRSGARQDAAPARTLGALAGAGDPRAAVEAVEALRGVLWEALLEQLGWPTSDFAGGLSDRAPARQLADLADRLAYVCAMILAAALAAAPAGEPAAAPMHEERAFSAFPEELAAAEQPLAQSHRAVLVDERAEPGFPSPGRASPAASGFGGAAVAAPEGTPAATNTGVHPLPWDVPLPTELRVTRAEGDAFPLDEPA